MDHDFDINILFKDVNIKAGYMPNRRIVKCCTNCMYSWFAHKKERRGWCRVDKYNFKPPNRDTPHKEWENNRTHSTMLCDKHEFTHKGNWADKVGDWLGLEFSGNGELIGKKDN